MLSLVGVIHLGRNFGSTLFMIIYNTCDRVISRKPSKDVVAQGVRGVEHCESEGNSSSAAQPQQESWGEMSTSAVARELPR